MPAIIAWSCSLLCCLASPPIADGVRYLAARSVTLMIGSDPSARAERMRVYLSCDAGRTWDPTEAVLEGATARFELPGDGRYECYIVLSNEVGDSAPPPTPGAPPHAVVVVDTAPPVLQLHRVQVIRDPERSVRISLTLADDNLGEDGLRLFYRSGAGGVWMDAGTMHVQERQVQWSVPDAVTGMVDIRMTATDLAGNRCSDEVQRVPVGNRLDKTAASRPVTTRPALPPPPSHAATRPAANATLAADEEIEQALDAQASRAQREESPANRAALAKLRRQAEQFRSAGQLSLAAARLHDAVGLAPNDLDLSAEYAGALMEAGDTAQAGQQFELLLNSDPQNAQALRGLARAALDEHRYADARRWMNERQQAPVLETDDWLLAGDVEIRLGRREAARAAWEKGLALPNLTPAQQQRLQRRLAGLTP